MRGSKRSDRRIVDFDIIKLVNNINYLVLEHNTGSTSASIDASFQGTAREWAAALQEMRMKGKFQQPVKGLSALRRAAAYHNYKEYDRGLGTTLLNFSLWGSTSEHYRLRKARCFLEKTFKDFSIKFDECDLEFTPGESYISSSGKTSIYRKLTMLSHWTTTDNCLEDTCRLIYEHKALKRMARAHIGEIPQKERKAIYAAHRDLYGQETVGYHVFCTLLITRVLTIVKGARASTVPKNNEVDRFINVEPMFPMILQRLVASEIRKRLERVGLPLAADWVNAQQKHKDWISQSHLATIDFSNASDSVIAHIAYTLVGNDLSYFLQKYRSEWVEFPSGWYQPIKLSSMGNGFTFEVMSSILYAIGRTYTEEVTVFGDDVIIPNEHATSFAKTCQLISFVVNNKKTFISSPFRESCGAFYHDDIGYITSYDFKWANNLNEAITLVNKVYMMIQYHYIDRLDKLYNAMIALFPASLRGPFFDHIGLDQYCFDDRWARVHKKSQTHREWFNLCLNKSPIGEYMDELHISMQGLALISIPCYVPKRNIFDKNRMGWTARLEASLYSGRSYIDITRGKGKWVLKPFWVTSQGSVISLSYLRLRKRILNDIKIE